MRKSFLLFAALLIAGCGKSEDVNEQAPIISISTGHALEFLGQQYLTIPDLRYDGSHPITVEAFVTPRERKHSALVANYQFAGLGLETTDDGYWSFVLHDANDYKRVRSDDPIVINDPVHIAGTFDGKQIRLFVDGKPQGAPATTSGRHRASRYDFMVGADPDRRGDPQRLLNGVIDEVRISESVRYTEAFTPQQRFDSDDQTLVLYHLDEGEGAQASDSSENGHHATISSANCWVSSGTLAGSSDRYKQLRTLLTESRRRTGHSEQQLAKQLRRSPSFVAQYENGQHVLSVIEFVDVCRALDLDPGKLLEEIGS